MRDIATEVPVIASSAKVISSRGKVVSQSWHMQQPERTPQYPLKQPHAQLNPSKTEQVCPVTPAVVPSAGPALPEKRTLPPLQEGEITKAVGEARCKLICDTYPEVFNGEKGEFLGADVKGIVYGKIAKKFYFLFEVLRLYRIKICIKIYMVSLGITP